MVIGYFDFMGITALPLKTDTPLVINSYAQLTLTLALHFLQSICGKHP
jgi:hypothetical protein